MLSIQLHQLQFKAYHGLYEEEKISGNNFEVDVIIHYHPPKIIHSIEDTVNYEKVYQLVDARMQLATPLLETIAMQLAHEILDKFSLAEDVTISIKKINPPIKNIKGSVGVSFSLKRNKSI